MSSNGKPSMRLPWKTNRRTLNPWIPKSLRVRPVDEQGNVTVTLSSRTKVTLTRDPGRALDHFLATDRKWVSGSELQDMGVDDPDSAVKTLEELGASFQRMYKDMVTPEWEIHEDAPHYKLLGLHINTTVLGFNAITKERTHDHVATTKFANDFCQGGAQ